MAHEVIRNINDLYYYKAGQSPVASKILRSGYTLSDERNRVIEADVTANGGKLDLKYSPEKQPVTIKYLGRTNSGEVVDLGEISDTAYLGQLYEPAPHGKQGYSGKLESFVVKKGSNDHTVYLSEKSEAEQQQELQQLQQQQQQLQQQNQEAGRPRNGYRGGGGGRGAYLSEELKRLRGQ